MAEPAYAIGTTKPVIFTIDDDPQVLRAVEHDLRRKYGREYHVLRADSGDARRPETGDEGVFRAEPGDVTDKLPFSRMTGYVARGRAHELNNPAAARLQEALAHAQLRTARIAAQGGPAKIEALEGHLATPQPASAMDPLARSDAEDDVVQWMEDQGLESTLAILAHKLRDLRVLREYAPELARILAYGSALNQVWTNLLDNAPDAAGHGGRFASAPRT